MRYLVRCKKISFDLRKKIFENGSYLLQYLSKEMFVRLEYDATAILLPFSKLYSPISPYLFPTASRG